MRLLPATLTAMRGLVVVALALAAATAYTNTHYRYHSFFAGATLGVLFVLAALLFRAHPAEVEDLPPKN